VEKTSIGTRPYFINDIRLQINVDCAWNIFSLASLGEEGAEPSVLGSFLTFLGEVSIRLNTMLKAVQLPARIGNLNTGLTDVKGDNFSHDGFLRIDEEE
jgi:hypothetical protein